MRLQSMVLIGDVEDKDIVIIDDICDTGGTLAKSAALLKKKAPECKSINHTSGVKRQGL